MTLASCPDCHPAATSCPSCGRPLDPKPTQTETTAKRYKLMQLGGILLMTMGLTLMFWRIGTRAHSVVAGILTLVGLFGGVGLWATGRVPAWWHHG